MPCIIKIFITINNDKMIKVLKIIQRASMNQGPIEAAMSVDYDD
jgi:hypothetical protein